MNERTKTGLEILQAAVLVGILGDVLLRQTLWGLNILLFIAALVAAMVMLVLRRKREFRNKQMIALNAALVFFAAMFVWRDSVELQILDGLAILTILAVLSLPALKIKPQIAGIFHYIVGFMWSGISVMFMPFVLVFDDIKWAQIPKNGWSKHLFSVLRGLAVALPVLFIFGGLFMAADAVFEGLVKNTFNIDGELFFGHLIFTGIFAWITAGYLRGSILPYFATNPSTPNPPENRENAGKKLSILEKIDEEENKEPKLIEKTAKTRANWTWQNFDNSVLPNVLTFGAIETSIVLGLINLLFLAFVVVQIPYLFGGMDLVQNTPDFKLAEYARRGFGELVAVAALVLPILLVTHWLVRKDSPINEKIYRVLAGIQIILLFVIMLSAAHRLFLLTGNLGYGLTTVRFYPMVFMVLLALIFVWFGLTVLRGARRQFAWGALWLTFFVLGITHVLNPDAYIVETNVRLMEQGREFDAHYNSRLSDDAVPALIKNLPLMNFKDACVVKYKLYYQQFEAEKNDDFRSFNFSRRIAENAIQRNSNSFSVAECPSYTRNSDRSLENY